MPLDQQLSCAVLRLQTRPTTMNTIRRNSLHHIRRFRQDPNREPLGNFVAIVRLPPRTLHEDHAPLSHLCQEICRFVRHNVPARPQASSQSHQHHNPCDHAHGQRPIGPHNQAPLPVREAPTLTSSSARGPQG